MITLYESDEVHRPSDNWPRVYVTSIDNYVHEFDNASDARAYVTEWYEENEIRGPRLIHVIERAQAPYSRDPYYQLQDEERLICSISIKRDLYGNIITIGM